MIFKTGNAIISPTSRSLIKTSFTTVSPYLPRNKEIFSKQETESSKEEMEFFSRFQISDQKISFITFSPYLPRNSKMIFKTGNGIISPTSSSLIKNFFYIFFSELIKKFKSVFQNRIWHFLQINQGVHNWFPKQEIYLSKQEIELFHPVPSQW